MTIAGLPILVVLAGASAQTMITIAPPAPPAPAAPPAQPMAPVQYPVDVDVRAGADRLFAGTLDVGSPVTSSFRQEKTDAVLATCIDNDSYPASNGPRATQRSSSFSVSINPGYQRADNRVQVQVRWTRPGTGGCSGQTNLRTVEMIEWVRLAPGQTVTLSGDAGLIVKLTRR